MANAPEMEDRRISTVGNLPSFPGRTSRLMERRSAVNEKTLRRRKDMTRRASNDQAGGADKESDDPAARSASPRIAFIGVDGDESSSDDDEAKPVARVKRRSTGAGNMSKSERRSLHTLRDREKDPRMRNNGLDMDAGGDSLGKELGRMNLEDELTNDKLRELEQIFEEADEDGGGGLDMDEFRIAMRKAIGPHLTDRELDLMFMKVDTNCDGTVDWDEYLSYMLLECREKDQMVMMNVEKPIPDLPAVVAGMNQYQRHHDNIVKILHLPNLVKVNNALYQPTIDNAGKYVSITKEGVLNFWNMDMQHHRRYDLEANTRCSTWVTSMTVLPNTNQIAFSTTFSDVSIYDFQSNEFNRVLQVTDLEICATCLDYWYDPNRLHHAILVWGDARGNISVLEFDDCPIMCVLHRSARTRIAFSEMQRGQVCGLKAYKLSAIHDEFVQDVKYIHELEAFISCSRDRETAMYFGNFKTKRGANFRVRKGVHAFDLCISTNVIVSGGRDTVVRVWNPYVPVKPVMLLHGHKTPIVSVMVIQHREQVISIAETKDILVFDLSAQCIIQSIVKKTMVGLGPRLPTAFYFNQQRKALVLGTNQLAIFEHKEEDILSKKLISHPKPVTVVIYNSLFDQVVSGGADSLVCVWNIDTGSRVMQFVAHRRVIDGQQVDVEITAMQFDPTKRRLLTAGRHGAVKVWNFNNGALLRTLPATQELEVTGIVCPPMRFVTAGWNRELFLYVDSPDDDRVTRWQKQHHDDILCLDYFPPGTIASGSFDGDILIWSIETGQITMRLNPHEDIKPFTSMSGRPDDAEAVSRMNKLRRNTMDTVAQAFDFKGDPDRISFVPFLARGREEELAVNASDLSLDESSDVLETSLKFESVTSCCSEERFNEQGKKVNREMAVEKLLFLSAREANKFTATLMSTSATGWVRAWSVHHEGGLLGQWNAAHQRGEAVLAMTTDPKNEYMITGDSLGYIKVWDITQYCIFLTMEQRRVMRMRYRIERYKKFPFLSIDPVLRRHIRDQKKHKPPPEASLPHLTHNTPPLLNSFRGHLKSVTSLDYIAEREYIVSSSSDCSIRMWKVSGQYIGIFGQGVPWPNPDLVAEQLKERQTKRNQKNLQEMGGTKHITADKHILPPDVRRVASASTLKVFHGGSRPLWKLAKNIVMTLVPLMVRVKKQRDEKQSERKRSAASKKIAKQLKATITEEGEESEEAVNTDSPGKDSEEEGEDEEEVKQVVVVDSLMDLTPEKIQARSAHLTDTSILGKSFRTHRRHQVLPAITKPRQYPHQCSVYSSLPFYDLEPVEDVIQPPDTILEIREREKMAIEAAQKLTNKRLRLRSIAPLMRSRMNLGRSGMDVSKKSELHLPNVVSGMIKTVRLKKILTKGLTRAKENLNHGIMESCHGDSSAEEEGAAAVTSSMAISPAMGSDSVSQSNVSVW